jgi:hypothetical protein
MARDVPSPMELILRFRRALRTGRIAKNIIITSNAGLISWISSAVRFPAVNASSDAERGVHIVMPSIMVSGAAI